jgi:hypothetical protein
MINYNSINAKIQASSIQDVDAVSKVEEHVYIYSARKLPTLVVESVKNAEMWI